MKLTGVADSSQRYSDGTTSPCVLLTFIDERVPTPLIKRAKISHTAAAVSTNLRQEALYQIKRAVYEAVMDTEHITGEPTETLELSKELIGRAIELLIQNGGK